MSKSEEKTHRPAHLKPAHVDGLYAALAAAGYGGMTIASLHLVPKGDGEASEARACHAELQPDGSYKIVC